MLLHVLKRDVEYPVRLRTIFEGNKRMSFMDDEWMLFTNVHDDRIRVLLHTVIEFLTGGHSSLLLLE